MTEREWDKIRAAFNGLSKEAAQNAIARLVMDDGLDLKTIGETWCGMEEQAAIDASNGIRQVD